MPVRSFLPIKFPVGKYSELDAAHILETLHGVEDRIQTHFPDSGLGDVAGELQEVGKTIVKLVEKLRQPIWALRVGTVVASLALIAFAVWVMVMAVSLAPAGQDGLMETFQGIESVTNEIILLAVAIYFFATVENRLKRRAALDSLHHLRSFAHVVDMHQLTKDPNNLLNGNQPTDPRFATAEQLTRYLDFCTDLLSINSKLAALHVQYFQDSEVLKNVNEVEMLSHELSRNIWQKIMILDVMVPSGGSPQFERSEIPELLSDGKPPSE